MLLLQNDILEMVAMGEPLEKTAEALCRRVEKILPGAFCSILTVDAEGRMHPLAAPSLPAAYCELLEGLAVGPKVGSCGTAIHLRKPIRVVDIASDPLWADYAHMVQPLGLKACWSTPIFGRTGEVVGAFAFYFREVRAPTRSEEGVVKASIHLCAIALEHDQQTARQQRLAYSDMLTGLPNRAAFNVAIERLGLTPDQPWALFVVDLDNLKTVNDTFGHRAGDCLLQAAATRIEESVAPNRVFRLGGDEFAVVVTDTTNLADLPALGARILKILSRTANCDGHLTIPRATIGSAVASPDLKTDELRQNADFALYHAKDTLRGGCVAYSPDLGTAMTRRLSAIRDVGAALREDRIDAYYQPIVRIDTGEIVGLEALFRLITPDGELMAAGDYFEATSDVHTATNLTRRMLKIVARDVRTWIDQGVWFQHVGINVSSADFHGGKLHEQIRDAFANEDVSLEHVILEVTETVYMGQRDDAVAREIQKLRASGLRVALDDFGTGYASLTHLLSVPVDIIKIDKSFIARLEPGNRSAAITEGLLTIAAKLGIRVVAEGVETRSQADQLQEFGCILGQGYLYSRAVDRVATSRLLAEKAQKIDPDTAATALSPIHTARSPVVPAQAPSEPGAHVRYAVLLCGDQWRVVSERRQFGRFTSRAAAFQCALRLAREASASGASVDLLYTDAGGELQKFSLGTGSTPVGAPIILRSVEAGTASD